QKLLINLGCLQDDDDLHTEDVGAVPIPSAAAGK
ncbi:hypothetical protein Tco_1564013, partial [Tanacetum coccineum]